MTEQQKQENLTPVVFPHDPIYKVSSQSVFKNQDSYSYQDERQTPIRFDQITLSDYLDNVLEHVQSFVEMIIETDDYKKQLHS